MRFYIVIVFASLAMGVFVLSACCLPSAHLQSDILELTDMDFLARDYFTNELKKTTPGLACGDYKVTNEVGCIKILVDRKQRIAKSVVYQSLYSVENDEVEIYSFDFDSPLNNIYIEKFTASEARDIFGDDLEAVKPLSDEQLVLVLTFFEKSAVLFYWNGKRFDSIWVSD